MSLPAARKNYRYFRSLLRPSTKLLVLVKANAYGHGAVEFASMMQAEGADYLAVALPVEGIESLFSSDSCRRPMDAMDGTSGPCR